MSTLTTYSPDRDQDTALMDELKTDRKRTRLLKEQDHIYIYENTRRPSGNHPQATVGSI